MIVWGVTGNNHDASLAVMEWRVQGLTDHYNLNLKWAGMSKDFSNISYCDADVQQLRGVVTIFI